MVDPWCPREPIFADDLAIQVQRGASLMPLLERNIGPDRVHGGSTSSALTAPAYNGRPVEVSLAIGRYSAGPCEDARKPLRSCFAARSLASARCTLTKNTGTMRS